jgi:hypothetical protein
MKIYEFHITYKFGRIVIFLFYFHAYDFVLDIVSLLFLAVPALFFGNPVPFPKCMFVIDARL